MARRIVQVLLGALALVGLCSNAAAQWQYDPKSFAMLPPYCKYSPIYQSIVPGGADPTEKERWRSYMGPLNFMHIHHYCRGLEHTNRALYMERTKQGRDRELSFSIGEFDYVLQAVQANFFMLPEIFTKKAENLLRLGQLEAAVLELHRAIGLKADYWPAYAVLADHHKNIGDVKRAREWLEKGLAAAPHAKALERRMAELAEKTSKN